MKLISKDEKIFIAGHNGMVGKSIYKTLKESGYENILTISREKLDLVEVDKVNKWFEVNLPSVVIIAAARVGGIMANKNNPVEFLLDNLKIQNNLIEASLKNGVKRLLFLGSSCIYPKYANQPIQEESLLTGSLESTNDSYAIAKIAGIKLCEAMRRQYNFDSICLMPTNLYGPGDNYHLENSHVIPSLLRKFHEAKLDNKNYVTCWGTGKPMREFLHVNDLGNACKFVLENWKPNQKLDEFKLNFLNVGTGKDISIRDLALLMAKITDYNGEIKWDTSKPDGTPKKLLDISRIRNLGWEPTISLEKGLKTTYSDFCEKIDKEDNQLRL